MVQSVNNDFVGSSKISLKSTSVTVSYAEVLSTTCKDSDTESYLQCLSQKFSIKIKIDTIGRDQDSLDRIGVQTNGSDVIIAPNILEEMATDSSKAEYYEQKIQDFFDAAEKLTKYFASMNLNYEPGGVIIHEDGAVTYIGGCEDSAERVAEVNELNLLKHKQQLEYIENLNELISKLNELSAQLDEPIVVKTRKFMPDGSILITTREDGKVVEQIRKKPHMISVRDPITGKINSEPFVSVFDDLMMM